MALLNYDIDFEKMIRMLLPTFKRKAKRIAWLKACLKPERTLHDIFLAFFEEKKYEVKWTGQTIVLEKLLQDKFGAGITITNNSLELAGAFVGEGLDATWYIGAGNDNGQFVDISYSIMGKNFTVNVPAIIVFVQSEMEAYINKYKLHGTTYEIVIV